MINVYGRPIESEFFTAQANAVLPSRSQDILLSVPKKKVLRSFSQPKHGQWYNFTNNNLSKKGLKNDTVGDIPLEWRLSPIQLMEASYSRQEKLLVNNFFTSVVHRNTAYSAS